MNRKQKSIIFISTFTLMIFFSFALILYNTKQSEINELSNNYYSSNHIRLIDEEPDLGKWKKKFDTEEDYRLFIEYDEIFRFYYDFGTSWSPPMQSGAFFKNKEKRNSAVVGKAMKEYIYKENGKQYVNFNGTPYEVIGIAGASYTSASDYLILLNSLDIPQIDNALLIIDGTKKKILDKIKNNILDEYNSVSEIDTKNKGVTRATNSTEFGKIFNISSIFLIISSSLLYLIFWFNQEKQKLRLLILLGVKKTNIISDYVKPIFINIFIAIFWALIMLAILSGDIQILKLLSFKIIIVCLLFISTTLILILIFIIKEFSMRRRKV